MIVRRYTDGRKHGGRKHANVLFSSVHETRNSAGAGGFRVTFGAKTCGARAILGKSWASSAENVQKPVVFNGFGSGNVFYSGKCFVFPEQTDELPAGLVTPNYKSNSRALMVKPARSAGF